MEATTELTVQQIAEDLSSLWEKAYRANDKQACAIIETSIRQMEQLDQNVVVLQAEREQIYAALSRYQKANKTLEKQSQESYLDGYNDGSAKERATRSNDQAIYQDGHTAGWQAAQEHYEPKLREMEARLLRRTGPSHS